MKQQLLVFFFVLSALCLSSCNGVSLVPASVPNSSEWTRDGCTGRFNSTGLCMMSAFNVKCGYTYSSYSYPLNISGYWNWTATYYFSIDYDDFRLGSTAKLSVSSGLLSLSFAVTKMNATTFNFQYGYGRSVLHSTFSSTASGIMYYYIKFSQDKIYLKRIRTLFFVFPTIVTLPFTSTKLISPKSTSIRTSAPSYATGSCILEVTSFAVDATACPAKCKTCTSDTYCTSCSLTGFDPDTRCTNCTADYKLSKITFPIYFTWCAPICLNDRCYCDTPGTCSSCKSGYLDPANECKTCSSFLQYFDETTGTCKNRFYIINVTIPTDCLLLNKSSCDGSNICSWCQFTSLCIPLNATCPSCRSLNTESTCDQNSNCKWCGLEDKCVSLYSNCISNCKNAQSQPTCDEIANCYWYNEKCINETEFANSQLEACPATELDCINSTNCFWCSYSSSCIKNGEECSTCDKTTRKEKCVTVNTTEEVFYCDFCDAKEQCIATETCTNCHWASHNKCGKEDYVGCQWCESTYACVPKSQSIANCKCSQALNSTSICSSLYGCNWCPSLKGCVDLDTDCESCYSLDKTKCGTYSGYCKWSQPILTCVDANQASLLCEYIPNNLCIDSISPGCEICDSSCVTKGSCSNQLKISSYSNNQQVSTTSDSIQLYPLISLMLFAIVSAVLTI